MEDSLLRDFEREQGKMQGDIANLTRHYDNLCGYLRQYVEERTIEWARLARTHPMALLLIVETTQVLDEHGRTYQDIEPIRITLAPVVSPDRIEDHLLRPTRSAKITGTEYHGLTMDDLRGQPQFADVWEWIEEKLISHHVIVFGAEWARKALWGIAGNSSVLDNVTCLHHKCKEFYGEFYGISLETVLAYQGIKKTRADLTDSRERIQMVAQVIRNLATGVRKQGIPNTPTLDEDAISLMDDLDAHPVRHDDLLEHPF